MPKTQQSQGGRQTTRLPLIGSYFNRDSSSSKDQRFINMFPETKKTDALESQKLYIYKRPGLEQYNTVTAADGRGLIYFNGSLFAVVGNQVYKDGVALFNISTYTGPVGLVLGNSITIGDYVFVCDGTGGWVIKSDFSVVSISDLDFPTPHIPTPIFIDGYILLAKGSDVYNCIVDEPTQWDASQYLTAEMFPDRIVSLARQNNQVVVFGGTSAEFFYDAANINGSPLSRNDSTTIQIGCAAPYAVYQNEKFCIFIGQSDSGGRAVWLIDGFQPKKISDEYIERIIDSESDMSDCRGFGIRTMGHLFYVINLKTIHRTLVYDVEEKMWHEWSSNSSDSHTEFGCDYTADAGLGYAYLLHVNNGKVYKMNPSIYQDDSTTIIAEVVTNKYDFDSYARKFLHSVKIVGDRYASGNSVSLRWTDDDYQTWSNYKTISLTDDFPTFSRLGAFRRRAFNIKHTGNYPLRLEAIECNYTIGEY
jgi:hypothetical protein